MNYVKNSVLLIVSLLFSAANIHAIKEDVPQSARTEKGSAILKSITYGSYVLIGLGALRLKASLWVKDPYVCQWFRPIEVSEKHFSMFNVYERKALAVYFRAKNSATYCFNPMAPHFNLVATGVTGLMTAKILKHLRESQELKKSRTN